MDFDAYHARAGTINIDDITPDELNRDILRKLRANYDELTKMWVCGVPDRDTDDFDYCYCPSNANDWGWLMYYIGENKRLRHFQIGSRNLNGIHHDVQSLFRGIWLNRSIQEIAFYSYDLRGGDVFRSLAPFFKLRPFVSKVQIKQCDLGDEGCHFLSLALRECNSLRTLTLNNDSIDDGGMESLMPALAENSNLRALNLNGNTSITIKGFRALSIVLESPTSNLVLLSLIGNYICDKVLKMLACALVNNSALKWLWQNSNIITNEGWRALSKSLCNTSSIDATFLSNHTIVDVGDTPDDELNGLVALNKWGYSNKQVAMFKILRYHDNFGMQPLIGRDFKILPCMIEWFDKASVALMERAGIQRSLRGQLVGATSLEQKKLTAIYQFICGMSSEFIEALTMHELKEATARKKRLRSELEEAEQLESRWIRR